MDEWIAYCGIPPVPGGIWARWNFDPWLLGALAFAALVWLIYAHRKGAALAGSRHALFWAAFAITALAFISPLCALSMSLFSARVAQHLMLTLAAAPLLAAALPPLPAGRGGWIAVGTVLFAVAFWFWHFPAPYSATLASDSVYWTMHLTLLGSAVLFWRGMIGLHAGALGGAVLGAAASAVQMSLFSALLFFSTRSWHAWHETTTLPWGLSPLEDQQLAALLMWVPGALVFLLILLALAGTWLASALDEAEGSAAPQILRG
jgi:putative membrane protein